MKTKFSKKDSKGKESTSFQGNGKQKDTRSQSSDSPEEFDFDFPSLQTVDTNKHLHCYSAILNRSKDETVTMEELDRLQPELEVMFSCAALRVRTLQNEIAALTNAEESKSEIKPTSASANKKKRKLSNAVLNKSLKDLSKVANMDSFNEDSMMNKDEDSEEDTDNSADVASEIAGIEVPKGALPKNDTPNKFWASVEPYCKEITKDNLKDLEDMISSCDRDMTPLTVPPLGRHYTSTWADEDLSQEKLPSDKSEAYMKRASSLCERTPGPLVQRLVSALMEDPSSDSYSKLADSDSESCAVLSRLPLYHTTACFERRLKRELEAVGFLDSEPDDTDEILAEIKKCDEELKVVAAKNKDYLSKVLLVKANDEMKRQELKSRIRLIEAKLVKVYRKNMAVKLKKKHLKKEERDHSWKLLKERDQLLRCLETL